MRFIVKAEMPVEPANEAAKEGNMAERIKAILEDLKPEAAYFIAASGKRTAILVVDLEDASQIPAVAEPWFLAFNAAVDFYPAMVVEDLMKAGPAIEQVVKKYG